MAGLDDLRWVTFAADADTPADLLPNVGRQIGIPPAVDLPRDFGTLFDIPGYARQDATGWTWVMGPPADPLLRAINRIPGTGGWTDTEARRVWRRTAVRLREAGVSGPDLQAWLPEMYAAALAENTARQAAGR